MDIANVYHIIFYASIVSVLIPLIVSIIKLKTLNITLRVLFIYILISVLAEALSMVLSASYVNNYIVQHSFTVLEFLFLSLLYYLEFNSKKARRIVLACIVVCLFIAVEVLFGMKGFNREDNVLSTFESCVMIGMSASFFYKMQIELNVPRLQDYYFFWINSAILIYFSTSFFLFLFDEYLEKFDVAMVQILYGLHLLINITYNILLSTGIWKAQGK